MRRSAKHSLPAFFNRAEHEQFLYPIEKPLKKRKFVFVTQIEHNRIDGNIVAVPLF